ncbi:MAG: tetratricopeptide repeat protein [Deltaproteobacteria bacterium]|nr:tetratricopeptide repeat protein [Deltaproteobacteria bacterium]
MEIDRLEDGELPLNIDDVMRGRLARLDETERQTLRNAAVVGETCWDGLLLALARADKYAGVDIDREPTTLFDDDEEARALEAMLTRLEEKGFLLGMEESDVPGCVEYCFRLPEMRELVAAEIPDAERRSKHALIARWLDLAANQGQRNAIAALLATHYERAGERDRAARAYLEAARHERVQLRSIDAVKHLERAIAGLDPQDFASRLDALHEQGSLLALLGRYDEALTAFRSMLLMSWRLGAKSKAAAALNRIARVHRSRGEIAQALGTLDRALRLFRACGDRRGIASCLDDLAQSRLLVGEYQRALDDAAEALELRRSLGDKRGEAVSLTTVGQIELARGLLEAAEACFGQALEIRERAADVEGIVATHNHLGVVAFERGDRASAEAAWRAALERAREIGDRRMQSYVLNNLGELATRGGRVDEAEPLLREAQQLAQEMADLRASAEIERNLGILQLKKGNLAEARRTLERAVELAEQFGSRAAVAYAVRSLAECHAQTLFGGESDDAGAPMAEQLLVKAAGLFDDMGSAREASRTIAELGFHLLERGDIDRAKETLTEARRRMRIAGLPELAKVESTLAELG